MTVDCVSPCEAWLCRMKETEALGRPDPVRHAVDCFNRGGAEGTLMWQPMKLTKPTARRAPSLPHSLDSHSQRCLWVQTAGTGGFQDVTSDTMNAPAQRCQHFCPSPPGAQQLRTGVAAPRGC